MKQILQELANKHEVDLDQGEAHLRLDMPHLDRLVIENIGFGHISVAHYFESNGDLMAEPDVVLFIDQEEK